MHIYESKVRKKYQTVVPMQVRESANIQEGDSLIWEVHENGQIIVRPQRSKTEYLATLNKKVYRSYENAAKHVAEEKAKWDS